MAGTVSAYAQGAFATPVEGGALDASVVLGNDNTLRGKHNSHDGDATIHVQSSSLATRPAAGTAQRVWVTTDGFRAYIDSGAAWNEFGYLPVAGGTVTGVAVFSTVFTAASGTVTALAATTAAISNIAATTAGVAFNRTGQKALLAGYGITNFTGTGVATLSGLHVVGGLLRLSAGAGTLNEIVFPAATGIATANTQIAVGDVWDLLIQNSSNIQAATFTGGGAGISVDIAVGGGNATIRTQHANSYKIACVGANSLVVFCCASI